MPAAWVLRAASKPLCQSGNRFHTPGRAWGQGRRSLFPVFGGKLATAKIQTVRG